VQGTAERVSETRVRKPAGKQSARSGKAGKAGAKLGRSAGRFATTEKIVTAGFVVCVFLVAAQALTGTDSHGSDDAKPWAHSFLVREVSVCILFLVLAVLAVLGSAARTVAAGLSLLVTVSVVIHSSDLIGFGAKAVAGALYGTSLPPVAGIPVPNGLSSLPGGTQGTAAGVATGTTPGTVMTGNGGAGTTTGLSNPAAGGGAPY
jgi:hypothetical protein